MRVLLISGNREDVDIRVPALGLACIAAATENAGHETLMLDLMVAKDPQSAIAEAVAEFRPEIIGMSARNIDDQRMKDTRFLLDQARDAVAWCRQTTEAPIVLGGAGFSILPLPILEYLEVEMGIQGEGEAVFPNSCGRIQAHESVDSLPGVFQRGKFPCKTRDFQRTRFFSFTGSFAYHALTSRGPSMPRFPFRPGAAALCPAAIVRHRPLRGRLSAGATPSGSSNG